MTTIDFEKFESLSDEEKQAISAQWTDEEWCDYYIKQGTVTIDEFFQELEEEAIKMANEKYGTPLTATDAEKNLYNPQDGLNTFEFPTADLLCDYATEKSENEWIVTLKEMIGSYEFQNSEFELPVALGKSADKKPVVADLARMPHLIISGTYGMGTHSCIHSILVSLLYKKHPAELKFVMIDTQRCDYICYDSIEGHYLAELPDAPSPIVFGTKSAIHTLNSLCREMEDRRELLEKVGAGNIQEYNAKFCQARILPTDRHRHLPYIVAIVDDVGQLTGSVGNMAEKPIVRLAQQGHTAGIHLILVTQRPDIRTLTDALKAHIPSRIAFRVRNVEASCAILDSEGAERLRGNGDMLFSLGGGEPVRLQGCFIGESEVDAIIRHIASQPGCPQPYLLPPCDGRATSTAPDELDPDFVQAATLVVEAQQASASFLQRNMFIGYNRVGHLMDQLEEFGIVGAFSEGKKRKVKVNTKEELDSLINRLTDKKHIKKLEKCQKRNGNLTAACRIKNEADAGGKDRGFPATA